MSRYQCTRCGETCFTTDPPHVCKDIRKRLERQTNAVERIRTIMLDYGLSDADVGGNTLDDVALAIIGALSGRDLGT